MVRTHFMMVARGVVVDAVTNNVSVFDILEQFNLKTFPGLIGDLRMVCLFEREAADDAVRQCVLRIELNGELVHEAPVTVNFQSHLRSRLILTFAGIPIAGPGVLRFMVKEGATALGSYDVQVTSIGTPQVSAEGPAPAESGKR